MLSLLQTRDGCLWIGTSDGLARFDGLRFVVLDRATCPELSSTEIRALAETPDGSVWLGTSEGLWAIEPVARGRLRAVETLASESIRVLCGGPSGDLWIATDGSLFRLTSQGCSRVPLELDPKPGEPVTLDLAEASDGTVWVATRRGLFRRLAPQSAGETGEMQPASFSRVETPGFNPERIAVAEDGALWGSRGDLRRFRDQAFTVVVDSGRLPHGDDTLEVLAGCGGDLWLGYERSGLRRWRHDTLTAFTVESALPVNWINCLLEDREGNLWIGTENGGLACWQPRRFAPLTRAHGLPDENVWALTPARAGGVWIGTDNGVVLSPDGQQAHAVPGLSLTNPKVRALHETPDGTLWIGTGDSLEEWRQGQLSLVRWDSAPAANKIRVITSDRHGRLWVGRESGLMRLDGWGEAAPSRDSSSRWGEAAPSRNSSSRWGEAAPSRNPSNPPGDAARSQARLDTVSPHQPQPLDPAGGWLRFTTADGLPHNDVRAILEARSGHLWLGTFGGGLCRLAAGSSNLVVERVFTETDGLPGRFVWALHEDGEGVLWAGTDRGLARLAPTPGNADRVEAVQVTAITRRDGLPSDEVNAILEDGFGHLWLSSDRGLARVRKAELSAFAAGQAAAIHPLTYGEPDGLLSRETNGQKSQPAACRTSDGRLWFPTTRGVAIVDPARFPDATDGPPALIERVSVDGETLLDQAESEAITPSSRWGDAARSRDSSSRWGDAAPSRDSSGRWGEAAPSRGAHPPRVRWRAPRPPLPSPQPTGEAPVGTREGARAPLPLVGRDSGEPTAASRPQSQGWGGATLRGANRGSTNTQPITFQLGPGRARVMEFHYTAPEFRAADMVRFRYRLEGWDRDWVDAGTRRAAFYTNLRPGGYRFEVQAASNGNRWGETSPPLEFRLAAYFHQTLWFWPTIGLPAALLTWSGVSWRLRDLNRRHALERENVLARERERIARDMHDDLGARLNHLALLSDPVLSPGTPPEVARVARDAMRSLDAIVWASQPAKDTLPHLVSFLSHAAFEHATAAGLPLDLDLPEHIPPWPLTAIERHHLFLACREALNNAIRHAAATRLALRLRVAGNSFTLELEDNGCGFRLADAESAGNGLQNMRERLAAIDARFRLESQPGHGTRVVIECDRGRLPGKDGRSA